jgi:hypothetical protein
MVQLNLNNVSELDVFLKQKAEYFSAIGAVLGSCIPIYQNVFFKTIRDYHKKLRKQFRELIKTEFEPKRNRIGWSISKERNGTRLVAVSNKRFNGKQIHVHIGSDRYDNEEDYWIQYREKLRNQADIEILGEKWCHYGLTIRQSLEFSAIKHIVFREKFAKTDPVYKIAKEACDKLGMRFYGGSIYEFTMDGRIAKPEVVKDTVVEYSSKISKLLKNRKWYKLQMDEMAKEFDTAISEEK